MRLVFLIALLAACTTKPGPEVPVARHSSSIAISPDGAKLFVVNPDSDSVSFVDVASRKLTQEVLLASAAPAVDGNGRYMPSVYPRALALSPHKSKLYISGERASQIIAVDSSSGKILSHINVGSEPTGILVAPDESAVYVACSNDDQVMKIDASSGKVVATVSTFRKPWALAWSTDGKTLYVTHLLGAGNPTIPGPSISQVDPSSLKVITTWNIPDMPPLSDPRLAYGQTRGVYDALARPGSDELWVAHLMLANKTAEPMLNFERTVFPTLTVFQTNGTLADTLSTDAADVPGLNGAFGDIVSGPHSMEFTADGNYALVADDNSEDVLVVDAVNRVEVPGAFVRPMPGHMLEGIVLAPDGQHAFVQERNTNDIAVLDVSEAATPITVTVEPNVISTLAAADLMPANMRLGQHLFFSANSDEFPITQNHWVACGSCHVEGRSDAVTWEFVEGPRDTPSNAGGTKDTGFLMHTADRRVIQDYWQTINTEQGGTFSPTNTMQAMQLDALESFVDYALPIPIPPKTDPSLVAQGQAAFTKAGCALCHFGPALTDSGDDNSALQLDGGVVSAPMQGGVLLHDVGTCDTGSFPDVSHPDEAGDTRSPCLFDTPALRGLVDSAPYFHDGSAATLDDALQMTRGKMGNIDALSPAELTALEEYLRSL